MPPLTLAQLGLAPDWKVGVFHLWTRAFQTTHAWEWEIDASFTINFTVAFDFDLLVVIFRTLKECLLFCDLHRNFSASTSIAKANAN